MSQSVVLWCLCLLFVTTIWKSSAAPTVPELVAAEGYPFELHSVTTEDGYILELHRIPHGARQEQADEPLSRAQRPPVLLHHGLSSSSADWVMNKPDKALSYILADSGFDVWLANSRGNQYSRAHVYLDPDQTDYWQFSWDEIAAHDLPAVIDYILGTTGQARLSYVGFSMGTTVFFALMSERPHFNDKVTVMVALGPGIYFANIKGMAKSIVPMAPSYDALLHLLGVRDVLPGGEDADKFILESCGSSYSITMQLCVLSLGSIVGPDEWEYEQSFLPLAIASTPAGTSSHTLYHFAQLVESGLFRKFDHGSELRNRLHYGQGEPPSYNLSRVTTPVALFSGSNDYIATPEGVKRLASELPRVILNKQITSPPYNHLNFLWGRRAHSLVYSDVVKILHFFNRGTPAARTLFSKLQPME